MARVVFARMAGDSRVRYGGNLPFSDSIPLSGDTRFQQLRNQFLTTGNKGNIIIGESVGRLFRINAEHSCSLDILSLAKAGWTPQRIADAFNEHFDYVVLAMANTIRPNLGHLCDPLADVIGLLKNKVIVLGMGMQDSLPYTLKAIDTGTERLLKTLNEKAIVFGVRGQQTEEWLQKMRIDRARAYGCPSLYVFPDTIDRMKVPDALSEQTSVVTAGYLHKRDRSRAVLSIFHKHTAHYVMQDEIFQPELKNRFAPDIKFYNDATGELDKNFISPAFEKIQKARLPFRGYWYFQSAETWRAFCARHDMYVGDRFHGGVAALQAGLPAVIFYGDLRVRELSDYFGIPNMPLSALPSNTLDSIVTNCLSNTRIKQFKSTYHQRIVEFRQAIEDVGLTLAVSPIETLGSNFKNREARWWRRFAVSR